MGDVLAWFQAPAKAPQIVWQDARTLVLRAAPALQPHHDYVIGLGVRSRCTLTSQDGEKLPLTEWKFRTR